MMDVDQRLPLTERDGVAVIGEGVGFERIRRITGYLVGTTDRFNNAKRAEERDRVKHIGMNEV
ncbi:MAG TPA: nrdD protein [Candidatus Mailhella excrementigallinarum]|nr:nrdD protein [Candidatus Mailhella excrementigallinarum]